MSKMQTVSRHLGGKSLRFQCVKQTKVPPDISRFQVNQQKPKLTNVQAKKSHTAVSFSSSRAVKSILGRRYFAKIITYSMGCMQARETVLKTAMDKLNILIPRPKFLSQRSTFSGISDRLVVISESPKIWGVFVFKFQGRRGLWGLWGLRGLCCQDTRC